VDPSFNVHDLHTVDDGVIAHIFPEVRFRLKLKICGGVTTHTHTPPPSFQLERDPKPSVIVGHFLGVDHLGCGFVDASLISLQRGLFPLLLRAKLPPA